MEAYKGKKANSYAKSTYGEVCREDILSSKEEEGRMRRKKGRKW